MERMNLDGDVKDVAAQLQKLILQLPRESAQSDRLRAADDPGGQSHEASPSVSSSALFSDMLLLHEQAKVLVDAKAQRVATLEAMTLALERRIAHLVPPASVGGSSTDWGQLATACVHNALNKKKTLIRIERQLEQHGLSWSGQDGITPASSEQQRRHRLAVELIALRHREAKFRSEAVGLVAEARSEWTALDGSTAPLTQHETELQVIEDVNNLRARRESLLEFQSKLHSLLRQKA